MKAILSIDGGGLHGIIPARLLTWIEAKAGWPCHELFDLVCGNSTGGIIALGLSKPIPAAEILRLYTERGGRMFRKRWPVYTRWFWDCKYDHRPLERELKRIFGEARFQDSAVPSVAVAYDIVNRRPRLFKSWEQRNGWRAWEVARATSAAPTYFRPYGALVDGALVANNPGAVARAAARELWPHDRLMMLSLGCGEKTRPLKPEKMRGLKAWAPHLLGAVFDGHSDVVDERLAESDCEYHRFQPRLDIARDEFDDTSPAQITALLAEAEKLIAERRPELETIVETLGRNKP